MVPMYHHPSAAGVPHHPQAYTPSTAMASQSPHYYAPGPQPGYPTLIPIAVPGGYAMGYAPMMHPAATTAGGGGVSITRSPATGAALGGAPHPGGAGGDQSSYGEQHFDPIVTASQVMSQQYQMQYQGAMMGYMQSYGVHHPSQGGGGGGSRGGGGGGMASNVVGGGAIDPRRYMMDGMYAPTPFVTGQMPRGTHFPRPDNSVLHQYNGGSTGPGSGGTSRNLSSGAWSVDIPLPGINEGPTAAEFRDAVRESGSLSGHDKAAPEPAGDLLIWLKSICASEGAIPNLSLGELRGHMVSMCRDQIGSRVVQSALENVGVEDVEEMFDEIRPKLEILIADQFGNYGKWIYGLS